jgi:hypothetical protein
MDCWLNAPTAAGKAPNQRPSPLVSTPSFQATDGYFSLLPRLRRRNPAGIAAFPCFEEFAAMKDFSDAVFGPEVVELMTAALEASVASLPEPVSSTQVNLLAESILRSAKAGERDITVLQRIALLELQISPRP